MTNDQISNTAIKDLRVYEGCSFLSGHSGSSHDNPIMYAYGDGFVVLARGVRKKFKPGRLEEALAAYRKALAASKNTSYQLAAGQ